MANPLAIAKVQQFALATIMARKGIGADAIGDALGGRAPMGPTWTEFGNLRVLGTGPSVWLAYTDQLSPDWGAVLRDSLAELASVSDQSSAYVIYRLSGRAARRLLQCGVAIDLHESVFKTGAVATTMIAHIDSVIWQTDGQPTYYVAVLRSFERSFRNWLDVAVKAVGHP